MCFFTFFQNGDTALHISAAMGRRKLTRVLLESNCSRNVRNKVILFCSCSCWCCYYWSCYCWCVWCCCGCCCCWCCWCCWFWCCCFDGVAAINISVIDVVVIVVTTGAIENVKIDFSYYKLKYFKTWRRSELKPSHISLKSNKHYKDKN